MKKIALLMAATALAAASSLALADGEALAKKNNCLACHNVEGKKVGPAFKDIAAKYKGKMDAATMAKGIQKGSSGKWGGMPMPPQAQVSDADAKALAEWILSL